MMVLRKKKENGEWKYDSFHPIDVKGAKNDGWEEVVESVPEVVEEKTEDVKSPANLESASIAGVSSSKKKAQ